MAKVRVQWREVTVYEQVLEIDDFDPDAEDVILDAIIEQGDWMDIVAVEERDVIFAHALVSE